MGCCCADCGLVGGLCGFRSGLGGWYNIVLGFRICGVVLFWLVGDCGRAVFGLVLLGDFGCCVLYGFRPDSELCGLV